MTSRTAFHTVAPRALAEPEVLRTRLAAVRTEPSARPLNDWVEGLRARLGDGESVPWFDPASGGVEARSLFLLEAPGQKAMGAAAELRRTGSGIISIDNDDPTARNCWMLRDEAGLPYRESVHWNVVPWYLGTVIRIAAPGKTEIQRAAPFLHEVMVMMPSLEVSFPWAARPKRDGPLTRNASPRRCTPSRPGIRARVYSRHDLPPGRRSWRSCSRLRGCWVLLDPKSGSCLLRSTSWTAPLPAQVQDPLGVAPTGGEEPLDVAEGSRRYSL
jgi:hypothetical protein